MEPLRIGNRSFRDLDSYKCAKRDQAKIEILKLEYDLTNILSVQGLLYDINSKKIRFESLLGDDFAEELEEIIAQLEEEKNKQSNKKTSDKKHNLNKKQDSDKNRSKKEFKGKNGKLGFDDSDELLQLEIQKNLKNRDRKRKLYISVLSLVAVACMGYLSYYYYMYFKNDGEYEALSSLVGVYSKEETQSNYTVTLVEEDKSKLPILKKYETLYQKNKKLVGWLKIDGTNIDYPVMQTVNNEYYLDHNYNQEYDKNGSIFMDAECDPAHPNDNMIIYGHHMKSGKMFGKLNLYSKEEYYKEHPTISFDTIYEEGTYDIMYVFRSKIYSEEEIVFKYYKFIDATSENEFDSNMEEMAKLALYDTGVKAKYGDKLITLSTCDYNESNGRFVIVAKKVK